MTLLYDGACRFCARSAHAVQRRFGATRVKLRDFQEPGTLEQYPGITREAAMKRMQLVRGDGRIFAGAEAFARLAADVPVLGWLAWLYYLPGIRQLADMGYALVASYRYRLFGRTQACDGGTCHLHVP